MSQGDSENQAIAENQPAARRDDPALELGQSLELVATSTSWEGPLPPPAVLQQYEDVLPGSAKDIFQRSEKQSDHRMRMESAVILGDARRSDVGLVFAFILALTIIILAFYVMIWVNPWAGVTALSVDIAVIAGIFVYGTNSRRRERERKAADANSRRD